MPQQSVPRSSAWAPTLRRSVRLFRAFRLEQTQPDVFYGALADDAVGHVTQYADLAGSRMLDVGGGPGYFRRAFEDAGATYFALDADAGELSGLGDIAQRTVLGSGMQLPFGDGTFDVCYSSNVLEHVSDPWRMADEMVRVTRPGGITFVSYTVWFGPWGGHETAPWHYLGGQPGTTALPPPARARAQEQVRRVAVPGHGPRGAGMGARPVGRRGARRRSALQPASRTVADVRPGGARGRHLEPRHRAAPAMTSPTTSSSTAITWRFRLTACCLVLVALAFSQRPGRIVSDTKFDLVVDPGAMLGRALHMWDPSGGFGQVQNQAYGYLFPMGPFFWLGDVLTLPGWVVQRMWWSLLLVVAFLGVVKLCAALDLGSPTSRIVAGLRVRSLAPDPDHDRPDLDRGVADGARAVGARASRPRLAGSGSPRRAAALSALAVAAVGGVNAAATFAVIPLGAVWLLTRSRGPRRRALMTWWPVLVVAGTAWWLVPLLLLGAYSPPFLDFIETASITTFPTTLFDVLRGTSHWVPYVDSTWRAGNDLVSTGYVALNSAVLVVLGLVGIALRGNPHRQFLALGMMLGLVLVSLGHSGSVSGWFAASERSALDGVLAPLRNVHKFEPLVRLPLVLGLAHVLAAAGARVRSASRGRSLRERLEDGDRVAYVGVLVLSVVAVAGVASPALAGRLAPADDLDVGPRLLGASGVLARDDRRPRSGRDHRPARPRLELRHLPVGHSRGRAGTGLRRGRMGRAQRRAAGPAGQHQDARRHRVPARRRPTVARVWRPTCAGPASARLVVRNDLRPSGDVPVPVLVHQAIEGSPGLTKVAEFGPDVGGPVRLDEDEAVEADGDDEAEGDEERPRRVVVDGGWHAEYPAIEVYEVSGAGAAAGSAAPPVVVGGPEDILELLDAGLMGDEPAVLALDAPDGPDGGGLLLTDGLRRREATFARVHDGRSATLDTADNGRRDVPAREYVLGGQARWETTAQVLGARSVDASGSRAFADTIGPVLPETLPYAAFDGRPETAWESGIPRSDEDPWVRVVLEEPREVGPVTVVAGENQGDDATSLVVETEAGTSAARAVLPGESVTLVPPPGPTAWIRVGAAPSDGPAEGLSIAEVRVQGLDLDRTLVLPEVPAAWGVPDHVLLSAPTSQDACVEVGTDVRCGPGRQRADEDGGVIDRTVRLGAGADYDVSAEVRPVAGDALEGLLQRNQLINVEASSTGVAGRSRLRGRGRSTGLRAPRGSPTWTTRRRRSR